MRVFGRQMELDLMLARVTRKVEFSQLSNRERGNARREARRINVTGWTHPLTFTDMKDRERRTPHGEQLLSKRRRGAAISKFSRRANQRREATARRVRQRRSARAVN